MQTCDKWALGMLYLLQGCFAKSNFVLMSTVLEQQVRVPQERFKCNHSLYYEKPFKYLVDILIAQ